jgi:RNA polymerase sigma-70 factor (ECF subfamily)
VYGAVLRDLRDPVEAEDVTQIAFLNAFRAMRRGEQPDKPRAWLVTIARNVIRRRYRDMMRRPQEVALDPEVAATLLEIDGPTAHEITSAMRRLPENQRAVILLREIQGRSYAEIAEEMDLSLAAVETLIFRARRSLSEELELADRVPTTRRRRALLFIPLPSFGKLSLGFSLGRAGAAALVGSVAMVAMPMESNADPAQPPAGQRGPSSAEALGPLVSTPTAGVPLAPKVKGERNAGKDQKDGARAGGDSKRAGDDSKGGPGLLPAVEVPSLPSLPSQPPPTVELPPLPVDPPSVDLPPLPVDPPPVDLPPLPVDPPSVDLPPLPVDPPPVDLPLFTG